ncbi:hypothetical protein CCR75_001200 [Bremia lactucae]|uniref:Transmembrane protein n=1 Tax=Bremia lactucae TaxID=4779 RepID=A0A976FPV1_BRELC|nr:hypothetical protein CCR75_001200 [Bremia lactucae]
MLIGHSVQTFVSTSARSRPRCSPINLEFPSSPAIPASASNLVFLANMRLSQVFRASLLAAAAISAISLPGTSALDISAEPNVAHLEASNNEMLTEARRMSTPSTEDDDVEPVKKSPKKKKKKVAKKASEDDATQEETQPVAPKKKKKAKHAATSAVADDDAAEAPAKHKKAKKAKKNVKKKKSHNATKKAAATTTDTEDEASETEAATGSGVKDKKVKGNKNEGVIDHSSEGSAEIDKIDLRNEDGWVSVYDDPPLLVIKASLYAFISYNDTEVCDTFNMTMNAVEQKAEENGRFSYHVVAYINCTKNGEDETQGRFLLNFIPEGKRLLLTECGHREEGEIVNWLRIQDEVPECMTPSQRKKFLAQPMKHIHATNGVDAEAVNTDFLSRLEDFDKEEVAIVGFSTILLIAIITALVFFVLRKRKVQKDLERTIAGAKAEHAVEDDDLQTEPEEKATKERKGLMDSAKAKSDDPDMEEGSFVNSPAVRV